MSRAFGKDAIVAFNEHGGAKDATEPKQPKNETAAMEAAMVEWHLLSRTHDMVISYATPFARTAAAIAEVAPIVVEHDSSVVRATQHHGHGFDCERRILDATEFNSMLTSWVCVTCDASSTRSRLHASSTRSPPRDRETGSSWPSGR
jgi:hypothetical protein